MRFATTRNGIEVSHLAYADDIIIFTQANRASIHELNQCLGHYEGVSGQKLNAEKSYFFLDDKHTEWAPYIEEVGGYQRGKFPFTYLGVPIFKGRKKTDMFLFLREKISTRIHSWSHKFLSFGGRLTLIKSTLGAIPLHIFQVLEPTKEAMHQMESLMAKYFWGSTHDKKATHWINWEQACLPIDEGGLGIRRFEEMVEAFGMKLWVRFREQNSLWARFMMRKYCGKAAPSKASFTGNQSLTWKRMARAGTRIHNRIQWSLGDGEIHFWEDVWWGEQVLADYCNPGISRSLSRVKDFWHNGYWNTNRLSRTLVPLGVPREVVEEIGQIPIDRGGKDTLRWTETAHGNFTTGSAWEICRHRQPHIPILKFIWNDCIPPSISIFIWRLLANRIPVDAKLQWRHISLASKCRCCRQPSVETREHLFIWGEVAAEVWRKTSIWFPPSSRRDTTVTNLESRFKLWHRNLGRPSSSHVSSIIPCLVLWFLWSERNGFIHRGTRFNADTVFGRVKHHLQMLITAGKLGAEKWGGCSNLEMFNKSAWHVRPRKVPKLVRWIPPDEGWVKLNTKGTFTRGQAGAGGIIRKADGSIIKGFKTKTRAASAIDAEMQAVSLGLELIERPGQHVWIELENMECIKMIEEGKYGAANLRHRLTHIRNLLKTVNNKKVTHIPRAGNKVAHALAKQGSDEENRMEFNRNSAPAEIKAMVSLEQLGLPNFDFQDEESDY